MSFFEDFKKHALDFGQLLTQEEGSRPDTDGVGWGWGMAFEDAAIKDEKHAKTQEGRLGTLESPKEAVAGTRGSEPRQRACPQANVESDSVPRQFPLSPEGRGAHPAFIGNGDNVAAPLDSGDVDVGVREASTCQGGSSTSAACAAAEVVPENRLGNKTIAVPSASSVSLPAFPPNAGDVSSGAGATQADGGAAEESGASATLSAAAYGYPRAENRRPDPSLHTRPLLVDTQAGRGSCVQPMAMGMGTQSSPGASLDSTSPRVEGGGRSNGPACVTEASGGCRRDREAVLELAVRGLSGPLILRLRHPNTGAVGPMLNVAEAGERIVPGPCPVDHLAAQPHAAPLAPLDSPTGQFRAPLSPREGVLQATRPQEDIRSPLASTRDGGPAVLCPLDASSSGLERATAGAAASSGRAEVSLAARQGTGRCCAPSEVTSAESGGTPLEAVCGTPRGVPQTPPFPPRQRLQDELSSASALCTTPSPAGDQEQTTAQSEPTMTSNPFWAQGSSSESCRVCAQLQEALNAREDQLASQAVQLAELQEAMVALQARNEELQLGRARCSEADMAELQAEFEARLGAAERRVFALQKERDTARRAAAAAPTPAALAERDAALKQAKGEAEALRKEVAAAKVEGAQASQAASAAQARAESAEARAAEAQVEAAKAGEARRCAERLASEAEAARVVAMEEAAAWNCSEAERLQAERQRCKDLEDALEATDAERDSLAREVATLQGELDAQRRHAAALEERLEAAVAERHHALVQQESHREEGELAALEALGPLMRELEAVKGQLRDTNDQLLAARRESGEHADASLAATEAAAAAESTVSELRAQLQAAEATCRAAEKNVARAEARAAAAEMKAEASAQLCQGEVSARQDLAAELAATREKSSALEEGLHKARAEVYELRRNLDPLHVATPTGEECGRSPSRFGPLDLSATDELSHVRGADPPPFPMGGSSGRNGGAGCGTPSGHEGRGLANNEDTEAEWERISSGAASAAAGAPASWAQRCQVHGVHSGEVQALQVQLVRMDERWQRAEHELLAAARQAEAARAAEAAVAELRSELDAMRARHDAAVEMLGEREEALEDARADLADMKRTYREQIDLLSSSISLTNKGGFDG